MESVLNEVALCGDYVVEGVPSLRDLLFPAFVSRHCRAGFSHAAALRLAFLVPAGFLDGRSWKLAVPPVDRIE
jgi:hypothetical protein